MAKKTNSLKRQDNVAFNGTNLNVDMDTFLSQHDLAFLTPATKGYEGLPIGNGDLGAMAWTPSDCLHFQINKCDTWDDDSDESFGAWDDSDKANKYTYLRHCGQLQIKPGLPMFDWMYLKDFKAHLSLSKAQANWFTKSPMGKLTCRAFIARDPRVMVINYSDKLSESTTREIKLARWGTRGFEHWYATIKRDALMGPNGTKSGHNGDEIWIEQPTRSLNFAMACKIVTKNSISKVYNARETGFEIEAGKECSFSLYISVVTSEESTDPLATARDIVKKAAKEGQEKIFEKHEKYWTDFWSKSFVDLSHDYLNNLWYLQLYQLGSSSLGKYPPHFINSLWSWTRDVRPWNHYYHWNQQHYVWPLLSSGHPELLEPYARWRLEGLPRAVEDAKKIHNCNGAFYSDVANRKGYQDVINQNNLPSPMESEETDWLKTFVVNIKYNITPIAQIASDLWQHYLYTLDEQFLCTYTYPILRECVRFYLDYLKKEDDGLYHIPKADPYETQSLRCKDTTSCIAYIRLLFPAFAVATEKIGIDEVLAHKALNALNNLAKYAYVNVEEGTDVSKRIKPGTTILSGGISCQTGRKVYGGGLKGKDLIPFQDFLYMTQLTPIFPTGLIGLNQKGTQEFEIAQNTLATLPKTIADPGGQGHYPWIICQARMGHFNDLSTALINWVDNFQLFPQGMFCYECRNTKSRYLQGCHSIMDYLNLESTNHVKVLGEKNEYVDLPTEPFAHMALEAGSTFMTTINEMLLQSIGGKIRVFPATPLDWPVRFTLHAEGGFVVTSEKTDKVKYVAITSNHGKQCCLVNPWPENIDIRVFDSTSQKSIAFTSDNEIVFSTKKGHIYIVEDATKPLSSFKQISIKAQPNQGSKKLQNAILGKPRQF